MVDLALREKDRLTETLSEQYSKNIINMDEYEKMIELVNKIETNRDVMIIDQMVNAYSDMAIRPRAPERKESARASVPKTKTKRKEHTSIFSSREISINPAGGHAGEFACVFGNMLVNVDDLPEGRTKLVAEAVFGSIEIIVPHYVKVKTNITPVFGGVFTEKETYDDSDDGRPELYIKGDAVFGNITIKKARY